MGGGNAQKSATARARNLEKAGEGKNAGGGAKGKEARTGGNMAAAMAEAQAKRDAVIKKRAEGIKDAAPNPKK